MALKRVLVRIPYWDFHRIQHMAPVLLSSWSLEFGSQNVFCSCPPLVLPPLVPCLFCGMTWG